MLQSFLSMAPVSATISLSASLGFLNTLNGPFVTTFAFAKLSMGFREAIAFTSSPPFGSLTW